MKRRSFVRKPDGTQQYAFLKKRGLLRRAKGTAMVVKEEYRVFFRGERIGSYYVFTNRRSSYEIYALPAGSEAELASLGLDKGATAKRSIRFFSIL